MKRLAVIVGIVAMLGLLVNGCAEERSLTQSNIQAHGEGWVPPSGANFHGAKVAADGVETCRSCHGTDLLGKGAATSCSTCHAGGSGGHPALEPWALNPTSEEFHARTIAVEGNGECATCHGEDYFGGWSGVSCYTCHAGGPSGHPGPDDWFAPQSNARSHGRAFVARGYDDCARCHGNDLLGGTSGVSCNLCHDF